MSNPVFKELESLVTEARNPASENIDRMGTTEILKTIASEDKTVPDAVSREIDFISLAVDLLVDTFRNGGRLFYIGAGTSGRLGVLDAAECPPTFGTPSEMVQGIIAGGHTALVTAIEGIEDQADQGRLDLVNAGFVNTDVACGIAASRRTPYVVGAIEKAREIGGKTLFVTCNPRSELNLTVDVAICPVVGPEVIMGSTRMKAGTATKLVLNMLTTATMIRLGKVYGNMMVDLQMNSRKLEERSKRTVMIATGVGYDEAAKTLEEAGGHVKTAVVMILGKMDAAQAREKLAASNGFVYKAVSRS